VPLVKAGMVATVYGEVDDVDVDVDADADGVGEI